VPLDQGQERCMQEFFQRMYVPPLKNERMSPEKGPFIKGKDN